MIAIKDMEMPSCCAKCVLLNMSIMGIKSCKALGHEIGQYESKQKRADDCPLIEIEQSEDCVSRQAVINTILEDSKRTGINHRYTSSDNMRNEIDDIKALPPVTPTHGTCKDCSNYVVGALDEEICLRGHELIHKDFYCSNFERRE